MDQPQTIQFIPTRFLESFIAVARELLFRPARFFQQLRPSGSLVGPFTFLLLCLFLSVLLFANVIGSGLSIFAALFVSGLVAAVLGSLCLHALLATPLFSTRLPYEATLSVIAYAAIVDLAAWIPLLNFFAKIYGLILMYLGFKAIHRMSAIRAGCAVFLAVMLLENIKLMMLRLTAPEWLNGLLNAVESLGSMSS